METASFKILSPNTNMYNTWSTLRAWKIASVATGSTADMREPNAKLSTKVSLYTTSAWNENAESEAYWEKVNSDWDIKQHSLNVL